MIQVRIQLESPFVLWELDDAPGSRWRTFRTERVGITGAVRQSSRRLERAAAGGQPRPRTLHGAKREESPRPSTARWNAWSAPTTWRPGRLPRSSTCDGALIPSSASTTRAIVLYARPVHHRRVRDRGRSRSRGSPTLPHKRRPGISKRDNSGTAAKLAARRQRGSRRKWRKRVGIEPTAPGINPEPDGFEGRAGHQTRIASREVWGPILTWGWAAHPFHRKPGRGSHRVPQDCAGVTRPLTSCRRSCTSYS